MTIIQEKRTAAKMTQTELSALSGVKQSVISDIENGKTKSPRAETVMALAAVLGFDWTLFYKDEKAV